MKKCPKCNLEKEFGKDKTTKDGLNFYCKDCIRKRNQKTQTTEKYKEYSRNYKQENEKSIKENAKIYFQKNREKFAEYGKKSYQKHRDEIAKKRKSKRITPEGREKNRIRLAEWRNKNKEKFRKIVRNWQLKNREKTNAHAKVHRAVENGKILRSKCCQECGMNCNTEGHHENYMNPLDVIWLCRLCHAKKIETVEV